MGAQPASVTLSPERAVIGIVIEVPEPYGDDIMQWRTGLGDPYADRMPTHITMLLPPPMSRNESERLTMAVDSVSSRWSPFEVCLGPVGTFRPVSPVVFLHASADNGRLEQLAQDLMDAHGPFEPEHPFVPHVTVAIGVGDGLLDAAAEAMADYECRWQARSLSMFQRGTDGRWRRLSQHPLGAGPALL